VLDILDRLRPPAPPEEAAAPPAAAAAASGTDAASPPPAATGKAPALPLPSIATLDPKFWAGRGKDTAAPSFDSARLMGLLSRTAMSSDSQDPAAMQVGVRGAGAVTSRSRRAAEEQRPRLALTSVASGGRRVGLKAALLVRAAAQARHQKPVGFIAVWPEVALLGHSCVPNTSQLVVADRLLLHAADELPPGEALTRNWIGPAVGGPLAVRQAAVEAVKRDLSAVAPAADASSVRLSRAPSLLYMRGRGQAAPELALVYGWCGCGVTRRCAPPFHAVLQELDTAGLTPHCRCQRCLLEASCSEELREALDAAHTW
jgi:hypothetical protein